MRRGDRPGFPRFRAAHRFDSLTYPHLDFRIADRHLHVAKVGAVKIKRHRPIDGRVKTPTIKREAGKWFACVSGAVDPRPLPPATESIGVDVGLTHFATLSDGTAIAKPRHARRAAARMRRVQRCIARRRKGSAGRREAVRLFQAALLAEVDPRGTSQHCLCGAHVPKPLSQRWHQCPACGLSAARDQLSARLILWRGLRLQDATWAPTPCVS